VWLPFDPAYPKDRHELMLKDARVAVLVTQRDLLPELREDCANVVLVDADWPVIAQQNVGNLDNSAAPENLAYIIYTSVSSGKPKGVMIPHASLCHYVGAMRESLALTAHDVYL